MKKKTIIILSAIAAIVFVLIVLINAGEYPVARVNSSFITARYFARQYGAASVYSEAVIKSIGQIASSTFKENVSDKDMRAVVLDQLVEQDLIHAKVRNLLAGDYDSLLKNKIAKYETNDKLKGVVDKLFGLSYGDFHDLILVPLAEKDLLSARLFLEGEHYEDWIKEARAGASVSIYSSAFAWDGAGVKAR